MSKKSWGLMTTPPELTPKQAGFLDEYLDSLDYSKIDVRELLRILITTQVLRDPDKPNGGKYDIFCGHNRTLSYALEPAETNKGEFLDIYHVDEEIEG